MSWGDQFLVSFVLDALAITIFALILTPLGLIARLLGRDDLSLRHQRDVETYWVNVKADRKIDMHKQS